MNFDKRNNKRNIMLAIVISAISQLLCQLLAFATFVPDMSSSLPVYSPEAIMIAQFGLVCMIMGLTIFGMKAEGEDEILTAAGFTAMAISLGVGAAGFLELVQGTSEESYEMFYYLNCFSNFVFIPGMMLIATYRPFKLWVRIWGVLTSVPLFVVTLLFLFKNRTTNFWKILVMLDTYLFPCSSLPGLGMCMQTIRKREEK